MTGAEVVGGVAAPVVLGTSVEATGGRPVSVGGVPETGGIGAPGALAVGVPEAAGGVSVTEAGGTPAEEGQTVTVVSGSTGVISKVFDVSRKRRTVALDHHSIDRVDEITGDTTNCAFVSFAEIIAVESLTGQLVHKTTKLHRIALIESR